MKLNITRTGIYLYHRRGTLSLSWTYRPFLFPQWYHYGDGDWGLVWLKLGLAWTAFEAGDPWGEQRGEHLCEALEMLAKNLGKGDK